MKDNFDVFDISLGEETEFLEPESKINHHYDAKNSVPGAMKGGDLELTDDEWNDAIDAVQMSIKTDHKIMESTLNTLKDSYQVIEALKRSKVSNKNQYKENVNMYRDNYAMELLQESIRSNNRMMEKFLDNMSGSSIYESSYDYDYDDDVYEEQQSYIEEAILDAYENGPFYEKAKDVDPRIENIRKAVGSLRGAFNSIAQNTGFIPIDSAKLAAAAYKKHADRKNFKTTGIIGALFGERQFLPGFLSEFNAKKGQKYPAGTDIHVWEIPDEVLETMMGKENIGKYVARKERSKKMARQYTGEEKEGFMITIDYQASPSDYFGTQALSIRPRGGIARY